MDIVEHIITYNGGQGRGVHGEQAVGSERILSLKSIFK